MTRIIAAALSAGIAIAAVSPAFAAEGCGAGFHRGPHGGCRPNGERVVVGGPIIGAPVVAVRGPALGVFYPGRGYWDGRRYYQHRERFNGGWRYR